jgi:DNA-binding protein HU-beta
MSKAFIAEVIQNSAEITGVAADRAATDLIEAIVKDLKKNGKFTLPRFGTFVVSKTSARKGTNPLTDAEIKFKGRKTVRFTASRSLNISSNPERQSEKLLAAGGPDMPAAVRTFLASQETKPLFNHPIIVAVTELIRLWETRTENAEYAKAKIYGADELIRKLRTLKPEEQVEQRSFANPSKVGSLFFRRKMSEFLGAVLVAQTVKSQDRPNRTA